jgi:hypothetical protein
MAAERQLRDDTQGPQERQQPQRCAVGSPPNNLNDVLSVRTYAIERHDIAAKPIEGNRIDGNPMEATVIKPPAPKSQEGI